MYVQSLDRHQIDVIQRMTGKRNVTQKHIHRIHDQNRWTPASSGQKIVQLFWIAGGKAFQLIDELDVILCELGRQGRGQTMQSIEEGQQTIAR